MIRPEVVIQGRAIGPSHPPYIIAEMSANHNGDLERALEIVRAAKEAGADAIKLQTYTADTMTLDCDSPEFQITSGLWKGSSLYDLYQEAHTPWEWHARIFEEAAKIGITILSSPFDDTAVDFLEELGCPAYKIASFEAVDLALIRKVAETNKPIIISTGMANLQEVEDAVATVQEIGNEQSVLLHCVSAYPTNPAEAHLATIPDLATRFDTVIGLSDHSLGTTVAVAAVAMGASVVEKHFTLSRLDGGADSTFSIEPNELRELCEACHTAWEARGMPNYALKPSERDNIKFRRSLYVVQDMVEGEAFSESNVRAIRPGYGLAPKVLPDVTGRCARVAIARGTALSWDLVE